MRRPLALLLAALTACVLPNLDGLSGAVVDAGVPSDASTNDASDSGEASAKKCDVATPFSSILQVTVNTAADEFAASLSPDEREIWFARGLDLFHATRPKRSDAFGTATPVAINTSATEADPFISADLLTLLFIREPGTNASWDMFISTRASTATDFGTAKLIAGVVTATDDVFPFVTADGKSLYFASGQGGAGMDIYVAASTGTGSDFSSAIKVPELSSSSEELGAVLTADQLDVYVGSTRPDGGSKGAVDVFRASRASTTLPFGPLTNVAELNTTFDDRVTWISPDRCRVYIDTKRPGGPGGSDIYVAERVPN